ncbi:MAG: Rieske 2Fe-2S domain-containing protein [Candidatus Omnitrophica bacterium]|nr:Rieske 2Fe-2S domain-containing protein [Candidatus Omnitrophota bacterium]
MPPFDFVKIKSEGLQVDFVKYTKEGYEAIKPDDRYRLKTYGMCAQKHEGYFMIRIRIPGGVIRADQMECIADLAERFGHGSAHLTTRGNLELHSVKIDDFLAIRDELDEVGITTRSACGHTFRNILCCHQNGVCPKQPFDLYPWVQKIHHHVFERADHYNPRMPNRMNVSFSGCSGCSVDASINDIGFVAKKIDDGERKLYGFELWVAGSLGKSPHLGQKLKDFITFEEVIPALEAITELHCSFGDHKNAVVKGRLKFLVAKWGFEKFREEFEKLFAEFKAKQSPLPPELAQLKILEESSCIDDSTLGEGIYPQRQSGFWRVQFWVPLGEISARQMKQVAELSRKFADGKAYHTTRQNFEFHWVKRQDVDPLIEAMAQVGFSPRHSESILNVVACPGTSFCSLAVTSAQGAAQVLMKEFSSLALDEDPDLKDFKINISGCPNSCAKHQIADIGFSGGLTEVNGIRRFGYQLYVGGRFNGSVKEGIQIKKGLSDDLVFPCAESLLEIFKARRLQGETFGDFVDRFGTEPLVSLLDQKLTTKCSLPMGSPILMSPRESHGSIENGKQIAIGSLKEWDTTTSKIVNAFGNEVAVFKTPQGFRACQNLCPHAGGALVEGTVEGETVTCPLHGWQFDLQSGACQTEPGNDIKIYKVELKEGNVLLKP